VLVETGGRNASILSSITKDAVLTYLPTSNTIRYVDRRKRNNTEAELQYLYDDRCCQGAQDVTQGWMVDTFPGVRRRPYGDSFHMTQVH